MEPPLRTFGDTLVVRAFVSHSLVIPPPFPFSPLELLASFPLPHNFSHRRSGENGLHPHITRARAVYRVRFQVLGRVKGKARGMIRSFSEPEPNRSLARTVADSLATLPQVRFPQQRKQIAASSRVLGRPRETSFRWGPSQWYTVQGDVPRKRL
jgi:hypothetical protein